MVVVVVVVVPGNATAGSGGGRRQGRGFLQWHASCALRGGEGVLVAAKVWWLALLTSHSTATNAH
jgi:hypothetical protein